MKTKKGIKYKSRRKSIRKGRKVTRKGLKHKRRFKRTIKHLKGGGWFSWNDKVKEGPQSTLDILGRGLDNSAKTLARTSSKAMNLVTQTGERSVELAGASVNLGLNITHGTVDTTNLAFLTVNTVLQRCLNFVKKRFDESYTQISQCKDRKYTGDGGECVAECIKPIISKFKANFDKRRGYEYSNLLDSIKKTKALIDKSIDYFCARGLIFGRICSKELNTQKYEANLVFNELMKKTQDVKREEEAYVSNNYQLIESQNNCANSADLCLAYIERLCIPFQKLEGINDYIKKQEDLLLLWNKKIEDAKQRAELESFLKTIDKQLTKIEKEKQIREKKASQKKKQEAKIEKVVSLLKKTSEIEMYEREILLVKDYDYIVESITNSKQILSVTQATIDKLNKFIEEYTGNNRNTQKTTSLVKIEDEKRKLELTNLDLEELEGKKTQIEQILNRENVGNPKIGIRNLEDRLKENIKSIEDKQAAEAEAAEAAAVAEASLAEAATGPAVVEANVKRGLGLEAPASEATTSEAPASEALNANKTATNLSRAADSPPLSEKNTANSLERAANSAKSL